MPLSIALKFNQSNLRDILSTIGQAADVNVTFERDFQERTYSVQLEKGTLADALQQILSSTGNFFKVVNQRTILIIPDQAQKHQQYDDLVLQTFYLSHSDSAEVAAYLNNILNLQGAAGEPADHHPEQDEQQHHGERQRLSDTGD